MPYADRPANRLLRHLGQSWRLRGPHTTGIFVVSVSWGRTREADLISVPHRQGSVQRVGLGAAELHP